MQENIIHKRAKSQPFPNRWSQGCKEQTRPYIKDKHETHITKHHIQESQEVSPFPAGDQMVHKRSATLERSARKSLEGLNMLDGTNLNKKDGKDRESKQSSSTHDPGHQWESDNFTIDITDESQELSPFPAGDHKASINRAAWKHNKNQTEIT